MKKVEFTAPAGFAVPEGTEPGKEFEAMATFQVKKDGRLCLVAIGDHKMPGYSDNDDETVRKYHAAMY